MNNLFLEQLFKIRKFYHILISTDKNKKITEYILGKTESSNSNIYLTSSTINNKIGRVNFIKNLASQIFYFSNVKQIKFDIIYINKELAELTETFDDILSDSGLIIYDKCKVPEKIKNKYNLIYEQKDFFVYQNIITNSNQVYEFIYDDLIKRTNSLELKIKNISETKKKNKKTVGIGILAYNHSEYINDCLKSVFKQSTDANLKIFIIDDCSTDNTVSLIEKFLQNTNYSKNIKVNFIKNNVNKGVITNLKMLLQKFNNTDYFTFCEGDDYWNNASRIEKFINYMEANPLTSVAFNSLYILDENTRILKKNNDHYINKDYFSTQDLIMGKYFIGNLGCCFFDSFYLQFFDKKIFKLPLYDFFLNTYYSSFGLIGHLKEYLSTYRKHSGSFWSSKKDSDRNNKLINFIEDYNKFFNYIYDYEYTAFIDSIYDGPSFIDERKYDLVIIDNIFPNVFSPFSYEEITNYLYRFKNSLALCTYMYSETLSKESLRDSLFNYKQRHPLLSNKISDYTYVKAKKINTKLMYFIFKTTTLHYYQLLKEKKVDFVFELYPGGGLYFDNPQCDYELRKITKLRGFKKVIVTQKPVRDYLIKKKICKKNQIELIFGVVMNNENNKNFVNKKFYGKNKETMDVVFMAHRYTNFGEDKGYDLFIKAAKKLIEKYGNIEFHVVGNFNENIIPLENLKDKVHFYGTLKKEEFDKFYYNKDIIVSPNRYGVLAPGAFDGFPTASCTEAGLRETVIICSDELEMSKGYYENGKDIILIKTEENDIVRKIEDLYKNPQKIEIIARQTRKKILQLYSYDCQMKPRIEVINKLLK